MPLEPSHISPQQEPGECNYLKFKDLGSITVSLEKEFWFKRTCLTILGEW